jgi:ribosomal protein S18 acetylase RimI-like enzyme
MTAEWRPGTNLDLVRHLEARTLNAWPAAEAHDLDGWRLHFDSGVTRRANSVWPLASASLLPLTEKLSRVEEFYARRRISPCYRICPASQPPDLDNVLAERGYTRVSPTLVQWVSLESVTERTRLAEGHEVAVFEEFSEEWFAAYVPIIALADHQVNAESGILRRIAQRTGFAVCRAGGEPLGVGLGVVEGDWLGIFCMATRMESRRRGAATSIMHRLAEWAVKHGASWAYLAVMEDNAPALAVYERAGFGTVYGYHYRVAAPLP